MCLYPKLVRNPKYRVNKKNGGKVPPLKDGRVAKVPIGCGYCYECLKKKANEWRVRLAEELKTSENGKFITLTFSSEAFEYLKNQVKPRKGYMLDNEIATYAVRRFLERWRRKYKKSVKHWLITELGGNGTENIHLHGIIFTENVDEIERIWNNGTIPYGFVWKGKKKGRRVINYVSERTVNYMVKYVMKLDEKHPNYKPKILCSKGIGVGYVNSIGFRKNGYKEGDTKEVYTTSNGLKIALPIYYRNKRYSEEEREKLWIEKLDKGVRYIGGDKVDAEDDETIEELLRYHQRLNSEWGYGSPETWKVKEYEEERRELMHEKRMAKLKEKKERENTDAKCYEEKGTRSPEKSKMPKKALNELTEARRLMKEMGINFDDIEII